MNGLAFTDDEINSVLKNNVSSSSVPQNNLPNDNSLSFTDDEINSIFSKSDNNIKNNVSSQEKPIDKSFLSRVEREPFLAGIADTAIGGAQSLVNMIGTEEQATKINQYVSDRERKIDYALKNDPTEKSYVYELTGLSPERIAGNIVGMPFGLALKGAGIAAKIGTGAGNFLLNLFTSPTSVNEEEKQTYAGEKGKEALAQIAFMGLIGTGKGLNHIYKYAKSDDGVQKALNDLDIPQELKDSPTVKKTLRVLRFNESALKQAKNAEEFVDLAKKYGIDAELNDALGGAIQGEASKARTTMSNLDPKKVRDNDARRLDQIGGAVQEVKTILSDGEVPISSNEVGGKINQDLRDFLDSGKKEIQKKASPLYEASRSKQSEELTNFINDKNNVISKKIKPYLDTAYESLKQLKESEGLPQPIYDSYETLLEARKLISKDIDFNKPSILGGSSLDERNLINARNKINSFLKKDENIVQADKIYQEGFEKLKKDQGDRIIQLAKKKPEQLVNISDQLFNRSFDIKQFKNVSDKLGQDTRKALMNDYFDKLTKQYQADTSLKRIFSDKLQSDKFMLLLKGDPKAKKKLTALRDIDKIVKNMQSSRQIMTNSTTLNKLSEVSDGDISGVKSGLARAITKGDGRSVVSSFVGEVAKNFPVFHEATLRQTKKEQDAFFDFIVNPKNTKKFIKVLNNLEKTGNISTKAQISDYLQKSGLSSIGGFGRVSFSPSLRKTVQQLITKEVGRPNESELNNGNR